MEIRKGKSFTNGQVLKINDLLNYYNIKRNGRHIKSLFNANETRPSMLINDSTNSFKCFSTEKKGGMIDIIMQLEKYDNRNLAKQKLKEIAMKLNMKYLGHFSTSSEQKLIEPFETRMTKVIKKIFMKKGIYTNEQIDSNVDKKIMEIRERLQIKIYEGLYNYCVQNIDDDSAINYLHNERCLSDKTIKKFKIFTISNVSATVDFLRDNFTQYALIASGLFKDIIEVKGFIFKRHTILFPYIEDGKIIKLKGRYFYKGNSIPLPNSDKYMNLRNRAGNLSMKKFYNMDCLKRMSKGDKLLICEGEPDTAIASQCGYNAIGISGVSNIPYEQIDMLKDYEIFLAMDNDKSGESAVEKLTGLFQKKISVIRLGKYKDITDLVGHGVSKIIDHPEVIIEKKEPHMQIENPERYSWISTDKLQTLSIPERMEVVPELLQEGLVIFAGKAKTGKTLMLLGIGIAVARGLKALSHFNCNKHSVLYLGYEDTVIGVQERINKMLRYTYPKKAPSNFIYPLDSINRNIGFPKMDEGGFERLEAKLKEDRNIKLIIIDTLASAFNNAKYKSRDYFNENGILEPLQRLANDLHVCIVVVHHTNKMDYKNVFDSIMGSSAYIGKSDTNIVITGKDNSNYELHIQGRGLKYGQTTYKLEQVKHKLMWKIVDKKPSINISPEQKVVYDFMKHKGGVVRSSEISFVTKTTQGDVIKKLNILIDKGLVQRVRKGHYEIIDEEQDSDS